MPSRRRVLQMLGAPRRRRRGRLGVVRRHARQRLLPRPCLGPFRRRALLQSRAASGPRGRLAFLRWQLSAIAARRGRRAFPSPFAADRPPAQFDGDAVRIDPRRPRELPDADARAKHADRSRVGRSRQPLLLRRTQARESARHRLRRPAEDRRRARDAQPLRPHGRRHDRPAVAALPPAHRHAARQRYDPEGRGAGSRRRRRGLGCDGRSRRRPHRARRADAALVGARHRRSQARAVGELRRAGGRQEDLLRRRQRLRRRRHLRARARAPSRSRAGAAADRRLRAALVHAQHPHEPGRGRAGAASCAARRRRSAITGAPSTSPTRRSSSRPSTWRRRWPSTASRPSGSRRCGPARCGPFSCHPACSGGGWTLEAQALRSPQREKRFTPWETTDPDRGSAPDRRPSSRAPSRTGTGAPAAPGSRSVPCAPRWRAA